ncbi:MAG: ABC transporter permease subunit, partial [Bacteroidales bacterium]|nr:ABC transporter permease subunit [Bacteroidales bacterium]
MKQIWSITKVEISQLFYSPIAWLIVVLFSWQVDSSFSSSITRLVTDFDLNGRLSDVTFSLYANIGGLWRIIQGNLYLFIPLLTMGLMSRDLSSGSIKLLYSSPVTSSQIVVGKYLSVVIFSLIMMLAILPDVIFTSAVVENMDTGLVLSGMLGLILLMWAYAAIGLFMSSLTSYQVVAALLTLGGLTLLDNFSHMGQNVEFLRDITYWAA